MFTEPVHARGKVSLHRFYKPGQHEHMLSHVCMLAARDTQLTPCCPRLHGTTWTHLETCAFAWLCAWSTCAWPHMSPCLHVVPWQARCFHGRMGTCTQGIARVQLFCLRGFMKAWSDTGPAPMVVYRCTLEKAGCCRGVGIHTVGTEEVYLCRASSQKFPLNSTWGWITLCWYWEC